jgi:hypothetical protein
LDLSTFIVAVFCLIDDRLKGRRFKTRGPDPKLSDAEQSPHLRARGAAGVE